MSTPYEKSRMAFDAYAGFDTGEFPTDKMSKVQVELHRWQVNNFGYTDEQRFVLGMNEELGELMEATSGLTMALGRINHVMLKSLQGIRGMTKEEAREKIADALADIMVFGTQLATAQRIDLGTIYAETARAVMERNWKAKPANAHVASVRHSADEYLP